VVVNVNRRRRHSEDGAIVLSVIASSAILEMTVMVRLVVE
jgi:hypothetical protein